MKQKSRHRKNLTKKPIGPEKSYYIDSITHDARGVARVDGKVTFITNALPNETVKARVIKSNRRYDEAILSHIEEASEYRVEPVCKHYSVCGGCSFQHFKYEQQLIAKSNWLQGQLRKLNYQKRIDILTDNEYAYRRRARLSVKVGKSGLVHLGFRAKGSSDIVQVSMCPVLTSPLQALLPILRTAVEECETPKAIGHIELLEDDLGCSMLLRLTDDFPPADEEYWHAFAKQQNLALYLQNKTSQRATCEQEQEREYRLEDVVLRYHPQAFIQVNSEMNKKMLAQAIEWLELTPKDTVLDLFCGVGNFTLPIATYVDSVVGVELQEQMVESAKQNAILNKLANVTFIGADLTSPVEDVRLKTAFTKIVLDPPRAGAYEFLPSLINLKAKTILYVSCDAATLARDAEILVSHGYKVTKVSMMEMFPQTAHIETMMLLEK